MKIVLLNVSYWAGAVDYLLNLTVSFADIPADSLLFANVSL